MIRLNLTVSDDLARRLDELSGESQTSKSEILRKALTLFDVAKESAPAKSLHLWATAARSQRKLSACEQRHRPEQPACELPLQGRA
jgi:predicted transcriptional regulator